MHFQTATNANGTIEPMEFRQESLEPCYLNFATGTPPGGKIPSKAHNMHLQTPTNARRTIEPMKFSQESQPCNLTFSMRRPPGGKMSRTVSLTYQDERKDFVSPKKKGREDRSEPKKLWNQMFRQLMKFHELHGHFLVTQKQDKRLADWIKRQRRLYKGVKEGSKKSSDEIVQRFELLEEAGIVWDPQALAWEKKFEMLKSFKGKFGTCRVPGDYAHSQLYSWIKSQRNQYKLFWEGKDSTMTVDRIGRLVGLGVSLESRFGNGGANDDPEMLRVLFSDSQEDEFW